MDDSRGYFKLGIFVLITGAMLVGCVVALGAHLFTRVETLPVESLFSESVAGLAPGSPVKYRGVTVGQVSQITFADAKYAAALPQNSNEPELILVEMKLDPNKFKPLTVHEFRKMLAAKIEQGLRVRLSRQLIGDTATLEINYVDPRLYPPTKLAWTPTELYIPAAPSQITEVVGGLETLVAKLNASDLPGLVHRFDRLIGDTDKGILDLQVATLREKAVALLDDVRGSNRRLNDLLASPDLKQAVSDLPRITGELRKSSARIDELVHDKRLDQILSGLASTASDAGPVVAEARQLLQELRELVVSQDDNIRLIVNNVRDLTDNGRSITDDLKQNPSRLIFGSPPPRIDPEGKR